MRTLQKALSLVLTVALLLSFDIVSVFAESDPNGSLSFRYAGYMVSDDNGVISLNLNDALLYNNTALSSAGVSISSAAVTGIHDNDAHFGTPILSGASVSIPVKSGTYNATRTLGLTVTYTVGGSTYTQEGLSFYAKITSGYAEDSQSGNVPSDTDTIDSATLQSAYDITLRPTAIAKDDGSHNVDIQLHLSYKGDKQFQNAPLSYFRIEPVVSGNISEFPFKLEYSSYGKTMADIKLVTDEQGTVTDTYFDFPFTVKSDAVNGYYPVTFKLYHLYKNVGLNEATPAETTITTYVEIRNGKNAADSSSGTVTSDPSTAILLLEGYELSQDEIKAGDTFDITLKIRNTSKKKVTDVKSTLTESKGTVLPVSGASSFYIEEIAAGETVEKTLTLKAQSDAGVMPVELTLSNAFVHESMAKTSSDSFILPVIQVVNLSLDAPTYATEIYTGDSTNLTMKLYNKGKSMLYNVSVYLESEGLKADETYYAGNMDSGSTKTYDVMLSAADGYEGQLEGEIVVTFEDSLGNVSERRSPISVNVAAMDWGEDAWYDAPVEEYTEEKQGLPWWVWGIIAAVVVAAGIVVPVSIVKHHRKKKQELEDEDEME